MAKKSSGKRSSNRVAQKASAEAKLSAALERAYAIKPGDKVTLVFGRVEKELGSAQFLVVVGKDRKVNATPLGVFTKKSCPITAGQIVMMEPTEREGQTHLIIARMDTKKDVKALTRLGIIPKDIFEGNVMEETVDDLFDWDAAEDSEGDEMDEEDASDMKAWKSRGKNYIKKKKAPSAAAGSGATAAGGGTMLKEVVAATEYAAHAAEDSDEGGAKKPRRRKVTFAAAPAVAAPAEVPRVVAEDDLEIWSSIAGEQYQPREVPTSWEDEDAVDIDKI